MGLFDGSKDQGLSVEEGRKIVEGYSPITAQQDFTLYTSGDTTLCSKILGYDSMGRQQHGVSGLRREKAMETALMITAAVSGIYVLYFIITYRIACDHVVRYGGEREI